MRTFENLSFRLMMGDRELILDRFYLLLTILLIYSGSIFEPQKEVVSGPLGGGGPEARILDRDLCPEASSC